MAIDNYLLEDGSIDWKLVGEGRFDKAEIRADVRRQLNKVLEYLKDKGKATDHLEEDALVLYRPNDWDQNPFHTKDGRHWYFTEKGINEAKSYVKNFLGNSKVRICKAREII